MSSTSNRELEYRLDFLPAKHAKIHQNIAASFKRAFVYLAFYGLDT
jgi:hypothetical protein